MSSIVQSRGAGLAWVATETEERDPIPGRAPQNRGGDMSEVRLTQLVPAGG